MKSPEDDVHTEEDPKNDNHSGDTIPLESPERESHEENNLEDENPLGDIVLLEPHLDIGTSAPQPKTNTVVPPLIQNPTMKKMYKNRLRKFLKNYMK